jgi:hypothetical protein
MRQVYFVSPASALVISAIATVMNKIDLNICFLKVELNRHAASAAGRSAAARLRAAL